MVAAEETPSELQRIGRYRILGELGHGTTAMLYLARVDGPGGFERLFAVKAIHRHLCREPAFLDMFLNEARISAQVRHPNVVSVNDLEIEDGRYFLAMDYVCGETLSSLLGATWNRKEPLPWTIAAAVIAKVCEGLHAVHELLDPVGRPLEVVHRDVAPQNIMVSYSGQVFLMDFGISKALSSISHTKPGIVRGTVAYLSPEQVRGVQPDRRSDLFSVGTILWESTVGLRLFKHDSELGTATRILKMPVPKPSDFHEDYPEELERIVLKALNRDREARYQTAQEIADDLHELLKTCPEPVRAAQLAEYMKTAFADRYEKRLELQRSAREDDPPRLTPTSGSRSDINKLAAVNIDDDVSFDELSPSLFAGLRSQVSEKMTSAEDKAPNEELPLPPAKAAVSVTPAVSTRKKGAEPLTDEKVVAAEPEAATTPELSPSAAGAEENPPAQVDAKTTAPKADQDAPAHTADSDSPSSGEASPLSLSDTESQWLDNESLPSEVVVTHSQGGRRLGMALTGCAVLGLLWFAMTFDASPDPKPHPAQTVEAPAPKPTPTPRAPPIAPSAPIQAEQKVATADLKALGSEAVEAALGAAPSGENVKPLSFEAETIAPKRLKKTVKKRIKRRGRPKRRISTIKKTKPARTRPKSTMLFSGDDL